MKTIRGIVLPILVLSFLISCAPNLPSVNSLPESSIAFTEKESYIIGPSDILDINVWKEPDLTRQVVVRMDGQITLPMIHDMQAENLTLLALQNAIQEKLKEFVEVPEVTVSLVASNSRKVYILGKINGPGEYPLTKEMTFLQAISVAGGLAKWAKQSDIRLIRKIEGVEKTFRIDYDSIVTGEDIKQNIRLLPDDTIFVP